MLLGNSQKNLEFKNLHLLPIKDQEYLDSPISTDSGVTVWWKPELDSIGNFTFYTEGSLDYWKNYLFTARKEFIRNNMDKFSYTGRQAPSSSAWDAKRIGKLTDILHEKFCSIWEPL